MIDLYRRPFEFLMPDHMPAYRTFIGSFLSLLTVIILVFYSAYKGVQLTNMLDYTVNKATHEYFYPSDFRFSQIDGF